MDLMLNFLITDVSGFTENLTRGVNHMRNLGGRGGAT